jgi:uncharacterized Fe-S cluster protein YjdI
MKEYKKEDATILWDASKCTHSGYCARQLGEVFKPRERPWISTENASKERIIEQVGKCPSGALSMKG